MPVISRRSFVGGAVAASLGSLASARAPRSDAVHEAVREFAARHDFSGVVALGRDGRMAWHHRSGFADRAARRPITAATTFRIGSASKWLTSVAVLRLAERGRLSLDAPIRTWLPELAGEFGDVPLFRLLSNSSGIPDLVTQAIGNDPAIRTSTAGSAEIVRRFAGGKLFFAPGSKFDYAFHNWVLVHAIVERTSGQPFERAMEQLVFRPAGLRHAGFADTVTPRVPGLALAYATDGRLKISPVPPFGGASGNIHLDAAGLIRAGHVVFSTDDLLSPESRARLTRVLMPDDEYALGGRVREVGGRQVAWETGKVQGYRTHLAHDLRRSRSVVVLNNTDMEQSEISAFVERLVGLAWA